MNLTHDKLKELLQYFSDSGIFINKTRRRGRGCGIGAVAGTIKSNGYRIICLERKEYLAHRLAWFYVNGYWPPNDIDHINGERDDNRIANLRLATRQENIRAGRGRPGKSRFKGVSFNPQANLKKPWYARIHDDGGKKYFLGYFATEEDAALAYATKAKELFGEFAHNPADVDKHTAKA